MTATRKHHLVDCNPRWVTGRYAGQPGDDDVPRGVHFDCPEGHKGCSHVIPFSPAFDGSPTPGWQQNGAVWHRIGDTFDTLTLSPSIRRIPRYATREEAVAAGCIAEYLNDSHFCACHIFIRDGQIEFCGDSR